MKILTVVTICMISASAGGFQDSQTVSPVVADPVPELVLTEAPEAAALRQVRAYMANTDSLQASFVQQNPDGSISRGTMSMERPGKVRFEYSDETPFLIVSDGNQISMIDEEVGQVTRWPVNDTPLRLVLGKTLDLARFDSVILPAYAGYDHLVALRARDREKPEMGEITIVFQKDKDNPDRLSLYRWAVTDTQGQVNVVEVSNTKINPDLDAALWTFEDPRGRRTYRNNRRR